MRVLLSAFALLPLMFTPAQSQALTGDQIKAMFFNGKPFVATSTITSSVSSASSRTISPWPPRVTRLDTSTRTRRVVVRSASRRIVASWVVLLQMASPTSS